MKMRQIRGAHISRSSRSAFTLLEVLLASLIAILLLSALYFAMDVTLRQTQESRDSVDVDNLARGVFTRIGIDLSASLGPMPPKSGGNASSSGSSSSSSSTPTATADPSAAAATTPAATTLAATTPAATTPAATSPTTADVEATPQAADLGFQAGVIGTDKQLTVFISRLPGTMTSAKGLAELPSTQLPSDLNRITYWLGQNGGFCRQERPWVTADGIRNSADPDLTDEAGDTLVQEVTDATFAYWNGTDWQSSWDGSQSSPDGVTPIGPPRAVKVTLSFSIPASRASDPPFEHEVIQIIPIRTAPGPKTPAMLTPSTDPGTTTADASGSGAAGASGVGAASGGAASGAKSSGSSTPASGAKSSGSSAPATSTPSSGTKPAGSSTPSTATPSASTSSSGTKSSGSSAPSTASSSSKGGK